MAKLFDEDARYIFYGVVLVALSIVFLLSSLGAFRSGAYILGQDLDMIVAFVLIVLGAGMVFSAAGKPGKPKFDVTIKEVKTK
ncbi:MAG: hypothetical protein NTW59_02940 [Candidatus Diapherotrites archaeon]|nr:hypothetical protein [Candidatus Diapherotrites archaeon]